MIGGPIGWPIGGTISDDVSVASWLSELSRPPRRRPFNRSVYVSEPFSPFVLTTSWLYGFPQVPPRKPNRARYIFEPYTPFITPTGWMNAQPWSLPQRREGHAPYQLSYTALPFPLPTPNVILTMSVTENPDSFSGGIQVWNAVYRAKVTIIEVPTQEEAATSIWEN